MLVSHLIQFLAGIHQFQLPQHREKTPLYYTGRRTYPLYLEMCLNLNCKSGVKIGGESRRQTEHYRMYAGISLVHKDSNQQRQQRKTWKTGAMMKNKTLQP